MDNPHLRTKEKSEGCYRMAVYMTKEMGWRYNTQELIPKQQACDLLDKPKPPGPTANSSLHQKTPSTKNQSSSTSANTPTKPC